MRGVSPDTNTTIDDNRITVKGQSRTFLQMNRLTNLVDAVGTTGFEYHPGGGLAKEDGPWSRTHLINS
jgi:hypothetical protein